LTAWRGLPWPAGQAGKKLRNRKGDTMTKKKATKKEKK
jgi:hypothetical protein